ncbi:LysE family translocator [Aeromonas sp. 164P]
MFGIHDLALFMVSGLLLNIMPGPDSLLVMLRSGSQGWRAGSVATLGICTGVMVHVLAAALGLSALLSASAELFALIKLAGAIYLIYLGFSLLRQQATGSMERGATLSALSYGQIYRQGVLTNVLNPKVALFFLAFVPQFIAPDSPDKAIAFILLGCIFNMNGMIWCHLLVFSTVYASHKVRLSHRLGRWLNRGIGALFVGLGVKLASD